jgi:Copper amine oxidase N-terminal domain
MQARLTPASAVTTAFIALLFCGAQAGAADFGSPPAGEIPILFNDHTVYATPDALVRARVLAAIVKGGQIYVPLRSMFEAMGATVSVSLDGRTITADKSGASVSVTLGKSEVTVDGETRPLDVPPMLVNGVVLVPVRVISEGMGAYVQWVPGRHVVVVRYIALPVPPPPATAAPVIAPTPQPPAPVVPPPPAPVPTAVPTAAYQGFIQAAVAAPRNYNEFANGQYCPESYVISAAYLFPSSRFAVKADFRQDVYVTSDNLTDTIGNHYTQFATIDGGTAFTPVFLARQNTFDARIEYELAAPHVYAGIGYLHTANNFGYPQLDGVGVGLEKLPDMRTGLNFYGSAFYYPNAGGNYTIPFAASPNFGKTYRQQYAIVKYDIGVALVFRGSPVYVAGGFNGDHYAAKQNAPIGQIHDGPYLGLGVKL